MQHFCRLSYVYVLEGDLCRKLQDSRVESIVRRSKRRVRRKHAGCSVVVVLRVDYRGDAGVDAAEVGAVKDVERFEYQPQANTFAIDRKVASHPQIDAGIAGSFESIPADKRWPVIPRVAIVLEILVAANAGRQEPAALQSDDGRKLEST